MKFSYLTVAFAAPFANASETIPSLAEGNKAESALSRFSTLSALVGHTFTYFTEQAGKTFENIREAPPLAPNDAPIAGGFVYDRFRAWAESHSVTFAGHDEEIHRFDGEFGRVVVMAVVCLIVDGGGRLPRGWLSRPPSPSRPRRQ